MKLFLDILDHYVDLKLNSYQDFYELEALISRRGFEVEQWIKPVINFSKCETFDLFKVGKIVSAVPHHNADKLQILEVDTGSTTQQIVCGADNARENIFVVVALIGAVIPKSKMKIEKVSIRDTESNGMICSLDELNLGTTSGIIELPLCNDDDIGKPVDKYLAKVAPVEIDVTPNRGDALSIVGILRELIASGYKKRFEFSLDINRENYFLKNNFWQDDFIKLWTDSRSDDVKTVNSKICVDIVETISDVNLEGLNDELYSKNSPASGTRFFSLYQLNGVRGSKQTNFLVRQFVELCGMKDQNNIVNLTNLVMLFFGTPIHTFDSDSIVGNKISVRNFDNCKKVSEEFTSIGNNKLDIKASTFVSVDDEKILAIPGIIGGKSSAVDDKTANIVLEIAWFEPEYIRINKNELNVISEAGFRFERGVDFNVSVNIEAIIVELFKKVLMPEQMSEKIKPVFVKDVDNKIDDFSSINQEMFSLDNIEKLLAKMTLKQNSSKVVEDVLTTLGYRIVGDKCYTPSHRFDLIVVEDIVSDIIRFLIEFDEDDDDFNLKIEKVSDDFNRLPSVLHNFEDTCERSFVVEQKLKDLLAIRGFIETYSLVFTSEKSPVNVLNALHSEQNFLRDNLFVSLTKQIDRLIKKGVNSSKIFEVAKVFKGIDEQNQSRLEPTYLGLASFGKVKTENILANTRVIDLFDLKLELENILSSFSLDKNNIRFDLTVHNEFLHPNRSFELFYNDTKIGRIAELNPFNLTAGWSKDIRYNLLELDITELQKLQNNLKSDGDFSILGAGEVFREFEISLLIPLEMQADTFLKSFKDDLIFDGFKLVDFFLLEEFSFDNQKKSISLKLIFSVLEDVRWNSKDKQLIIDKLEKILPPKVSLRTAKNGDK
ncbi:MAG: phenylalanine--tRNA ligase subunit beta [Alphaproteobacteria bacterium]|nr:phenylalanine--tRNA ligase subunit beta [Alphaproteobacteria bacterium]